MQTERVGGRDNSEISRKINEATDAPQKDCEEFTLEEVHKSVVHTFK